MQVTFPPAVKASYTYRCTDNGVIYVDFLSDDVSANLRVKQTGATTTLRAPAADNNFAGNGYETPAAAS